MENDLATSDPAGSSPPMVTSRSSNVVVRARRSGETEVSLAPPATVSSPKRTGPAGRGGFELGGVPGVSSGWPSPFGGEGFGRAAFVGEDFVGEDFVGEDFIAEPAGGRDGPEPAPREGPASEAGGVMVASAAALGVLVDHPA